MSTNTPNYNLIKPDANEFYDVNVQNDNLDAIDQAIKENSDAAAVNSQASSDNEDSINALAQTAAANTQAISDNADAIAGNAQTAALHEQYAAQMKSGIDLSAADVTLGSGDYYKGLIVAAAAHDTHALILPGVGSHKYDIYNADAEHTLLVKKAGGTAVEVPPQKLCRVVYDGMEYRAIEGSDAILYKNPSPIKAGDAVAGNLLSWIEENGQWEKREFGMPYDGSNIVSAGKFESEGLFPESETGYKLFRQADGTVGTTVRSEVYYLGWVENQDTAWIGMMGGVDMEYTDDMESFFTVPGISGKVRLKIKMPATADGVMVRRSTSAYDGSGISWGDLVANITDDALYSGDNQWYKDDNGGLGLVNGTRYYYKAFPYVSGTYNVIGGNNESSCKAGGLNCEFSMDAVGGSIVYDDANSNNGTAYNITYSAGKVKNQAVFNGVNAKILADNMLSAAQLDGDFTVEMWFYSNNMPSSTEMLLSFRKYRWISIYLASGNSLRAYLYNSGENNVVTSINSATWYHLVFIRSKSNGLELFLNNVSVDTDSYTGNANSSSDSSTVGCRVASEYFDGRIDQLRLYSRVLEDFEIDSLYQEGKGC